MDGDGNSKDDVKIPESDLGKEIEAAFEDGKDCMVTIIAAMGKWTSRPPERSGSNDEDTSADPIIDEEQAVSWKEAPQN